MHIGYFRFVYFSGRFIGVTTDDVDCRYADCFREPVRIMRAMGFKNEDDYRLSHPSAWRSKDPKVQPEFVGYQNGHAKFKNDNDDRIAVYTIEYVDPYHDRRYSCNTLSPDFLDPNYIVTYSKMNSGPILTPLERIDSVFEEVFDKENGNPMFMIQPTVQSTCAVDEHYKRGEYNPDLFWFCSDYDDHVLRCKIMSEAFELSREEYNYQPNYDDGDEARWSTVKSNLARREQMLKDMYL